jgi:Flp pilus assembly protein TadG
MASYSTADLLQSMLQNQRLNQVTEAAAAAVTTEDQEETTKILDTSIFNRYTERYTGFFYVNRH